MYGFPGLATFSNSFQFNHDPKEVNSKGGVPVPTLVSYHCRSLTLVDLTSSIGYLGHQSRALVLEAPTSLDQCTPTLHPP